MKPHGAQMTLTNGIDIGVRNSAPASYQRFSVPIALAGPTGSARREIPVASSAVR